MTSALHKLPLILTVDTETPHVRAEQPEQMEGAKEPKTKIETIMQVNDMNLQLSTDYIPFLDKVQQELGIRSYTSWSGPDAATRLMETLAAVHVLYEEQQLAHPTPVLTDEQLAAFHETTHCHLCAKEFPFLTDVEDTIDLSDYKVRGHDHFTGEYLGAPHSKCNLQAQERRNRVPILAHNGSRFDYRLLCCYLDVFVRKIIELLRQRATPELMKAKLIQWNSADFTHGKKSASTRRQIATRVVNAMSDEQVRRAFFEKAEKKYSEPSAIAVTSDQFKSITVGIFTFVDSFGFVAKPLDEWVEQTTNKFKDLSMLHCLRKSLPAGAGSEEDRLKMLARKVINFLKLN